MAASTLTAAGAQRTFTSATRGATTSYAPGTITPRRPCRGSEQAVRATAAAASVSVPQYILPFKLDKNASTERVRAWLGSSPGDLKNRSSFERGQGTYAPFWRFDADAASNRQTAVCYLPA